MKALLKALIRYVTLRRVMQVKIGDKELYEAPGIAVFMNVWVLDDGVAITDLGGGSYRVTVTGWMQIGHPVEFTFITDESGLEWLYPTDGGWKLLGYAGPGGVSATAAVNGMMHFSLTDAQD